MNRKSLQVKTMTKRKDFTVRVVTDARYLKSRRHIHEEWQHRFKYNTLVYVHTYPSQAAASMPRRSQSQDLSSSSPPTREGHLTGWRTRCSLLETASKSISTASMPSLAVFCREFLHKPASALPFLLKREAKINPKRATDPADAGRL
jgi:hypothetical protein